MGRVVVKGVEFLKTVLDTGTVYVLCVRSGGGWIRRYRLTGTSLLLAQTWWANKCPFGVLLDRLQEEPVEVQPEGLGDEVAVLDAVQWLRENRKDWT